MTLPGAAPGVEDAQVAEQVEIQAKYQGYIDRQQEEIARHEHFEDLTAAAGRRLRPAARTVGRGAAETQPAPPGDAWPGFAHLGRDTGGDLGAAGASQAQDEHSASGRAGLNRRGRAHRRQDGMTLAQQLAQGVLQLGFTLPAGAQQRLLEYLALLQKWNRVYNLTAVREAPRMVSQHLLDCLAAAPHVAAATLLDVGSGAGLPGIPLALALPDARVTLLDSNHKKAAFLTQAVIELKLVNAEVVCERAETWNPSTTFEVVISRAFSDLARVRFPGRPARRCGWAAGGHEGRAPV